MREVRKKRREKENKKTQLIVKKKMKKENQKTQLTFRRQQNEWASGDPKQGRDHRPHNGAKHHTAEGLTVSTLL